MQVLKKSLQRHWSNSAFVKSLLMMILILCVVKGGETVFEGSKQKAFAEDSIFTRLK
tara:strand:+ start:1253 stop:1423 length:171 start_codon:yes stop_codon:yes gene_type:complete